MSKESLRDIAASVHQRLLNRARDSDRTFNELLQYYAMERFLYRLSCSDYAQQFTLKGALMLTVWGAPFTRPTRDIDLLGELNNSTELIADIVRQICNQEVEPDGLRFEAETIEVQRIAEQADYHGVRAKFRGYLGNARIPMQVDIGFGDTVAGAGGYIDYPTIFNMPTPSLRGYSRESAIAEKLETMVKMGEINSRMRDFYDIWLLSRRFEFDGRVLTNAIRRTFDTRGTDIPEKPVALTDRFSEDKQGSWRAFVDKSPLGGITDDFKEVLEDLRRFLVPVLNALAAQKDFTGIWPPTGPWQG